MKTLNSELGISNTYMWMTQLTLLILLFITIYYFVRGLLGNRRKKRMYIGINKLDQQHRLKWFRKLLMIPPSTSLPTRVRQQLLTGCGIAWKAETYFVVKRMLILTLITILTLMIFLEKNYGSFGFQLRVIEISIASILTVVLMDKPLLESIMRHRRQRIINDVYTISRQLLYYSGSSMNLHTKLVRCLPYASSIRNELYLLTNEWYHNSAYAIAQFKHRIGTEEGFSFAETLDSLRQHDDEQYYELLRQRVLDYKEKLELSKEGRKETMSYVLFILAGIPILFTFRLFVYPWVAEGQKLFDSLG